MDYNITYREKDKGIQFIISYKDYNGKWKQKSKQGFSTKKEAKRAADKMLDNLKDNLLIAPPPEFESITFGEFSKEYLKHTEIYREYKTVQSTKTVLNKFSSLNDTELLKLTVLDIQKVVDSMTKEGLNPNTIRYYLKKLNIMFNAAKDKYQIVINVPLKNISVNKPKEIIKRALTDDEVNAVLNDFRNTKYYLVIFIAINTGMRLGEILGLTWKDIDFKNNTVSVNKQWKKLKDGTYGFGELKSKNSNRIIPISKYVSNELLKHKNTANIVNIDSRILGFKHKDNLIVTLNNSLKRYGHDISIHELRHTYATKLISNGLDFKTAASILGHDIQQTIKTYSHVNNDMLNKAKTLIEYIF